MLPKFYSERPILWQQLFYITTNGLHVPHCNCEVNFLEKHQKCPVKTCDPKGRLDFSSVWFLSRWRRWRSAVADMLQRVVHTVSALSKSVQPVDGPRRHLESPRRLTNDRLKEITMKRANERQNRCHMASSNPHSP